MENEKETINYRKDDETTELLAEMNRIGIKQFREMWGQEAIDRIKEIAKAEERMAPIRQKIRLQGKLKSDWPSCEKCTNWSNPDKKNWKICPYENLEKNITFEINELSQNPIAVEVCEKFNWQKDS